MKKILTTKQRFSRMSAVSAVIVLVASGCQKDNPPALIGNFQQVNLVATAGYAPARIDPNLANAWGLAFSSGGTPWISAQASHVSTVYTPEGGQARVPVTIPSPGAVTGGNPTGCVFYPGTTDFLLPNGQSARFIFDGVDGVVSAWNGAAGNAAVTLVNNASIAGYTGLALASDGGANFLYAANFRAGRIDVFDKNWAPVNTKLFKDPKLPSGYSPFNVQNIGDILFVMYAKVGADGRDQAGAGYGYVNMFRTNGTLISRFASKGKLNAPWGIALAPAGFFTTETKGYENESAILVGNFGDGRISAYSTDGDYLGQLRVNGSALVIDGLWALSFPPGTATAIDPNRLYFTAGPEHEKQGLFGYIIKK